MHQQDYFENDQFSFKTLRSAEYYRAPEFFLHVYLDDPRMLDTWRMSRDAFLKGASLADHPIISVEIPFG